MKRLIPTLCSLAFLSACVVHVGGPATAAELTQQQQQLTLDTRQLTNFLAETGAGDITIIGEANRQQITVDATLHYNEPSDIRLVLEQRNNQAFLLAETVNNKVGLGWQQMSYVDLVVYVPASMAVELQDGSGDALLRGLTHSITIDDGSGDLNVTGGANVKIKDGSGQVAISQLTGNLTLDDGSGDVTINNVQGAVSIEDGSGDLALTIVGDVTIDDGSGDISVTDAASLTIPSSGSGDIAYSQIRGNIMTDEKTDELRE